MIHLLADHPGFFDVPESYKREQGVLMFSFVVVVLLSLQSDNIMNLLSVPYPTSP